MSRTRGPRSRWRARGVAGLLAALLLSGGAAAQAPLSETRKAQVEAFSQRGVAAYRAGRYVEAVEYFQKAYAIFPEPKLLYNIGRAHEKAGDAATATLFYEQATADPATPAAVRTKAQARLTALTGRPAPPAAVPVPVSAAPQSAAPQSAAPQSAATDGAAPIAVPVSAAPVAVPVSSAPIAVPVSAAPVARITVTPPAPPIRERVEPAASGGLREGVGWTLVGVGSMAAIVGGVAYAAGASDHQTVEDAKQGGVGTLTRSEALDLRASGSDRKTLGVTLLAVGGGALISGLVLFLSGEPPAEATRVGLSPTGLGFGGRF